MQAAHSETNCQNEIVRWNGVETYADYCNRSLDFWLARGAGRDTAADGKAAMERLKAKLVASAAQSMLRSAMRQVRWYKARPTRLDALSWGMSLLPAPQLLARAESLYEGARHERSYRVPNVGLINAAAALICARRLCREEAAAVAA